MWGRESALSHKSVIFILEEFDLFAQVTSFGVFLETIANELVFRSM
jgi:hypothetical protein